MLLIFNRAIASVQPIEGEANVLICFEHGEEAEAAVDRQCLLYPDENK